MDTRCNRVNSLEVTEEVVSKWNSNLSLLKSKLCEGIDFTTGKYIDFKRDISTTNTQLSDKEIVFDTNFSLEELDDGDETEDNENFIIQAWIR